MNRCQSMKRIIKAILDIFPDSISSTLLFYIRNIKGKKMAEVWEKNGRKGAPPHIVKQKIVAGFGKRFHCETLVESGTFQGDMVQAQKNNFERIYSIELSPELRQKAARRFRGTKHIKIIQGDSGKVIPEIMPLLKGKTLFWLDGHYSGGITAKGEKECPIFEELDAILGHNQLKHVILIDDARLFNGTHDYPELDDLFAYVTSRLNDYGPSFVENDIICFLPND